MAEGKRRERQTVAFPCRAANRDKSAAGWRGRAARFCCIPIYFFYICLPSRGVTAGPPLTTPSPSMRATTAAEGPLNQNHRRGHHPSHRHSSTTTRHRRRTAAAAPGAAAPHGPAPSSRSLAAAAAPGAKRAAARQRRRLPPRPRCRTACGNAQPRRRRRSPETPRAPARAAAAPAPSARRPAARTSRRSTCPARKLQKGMGRNERP